MSKPCETSFMVPGHIQPWQRRTAGGHKPKPTREFQAKVAMFAKAAGCNPVENMAVRVKMFFVLPRPKRGYRKYPSSSDLDNMCKSVLDALKGIAYKDDRQVTELEAFKGFALGREVEGVSVKVTALRESHPIGMRRAGKGRATPTGTEA